MIWRLTLLLFFLFPLALSAQEICNNGIDDDGDGLIDLNDPDCPCSTLIAPADLASYIRNPSFENQLCCPFSFVSAISPPWLDCADGWHQATSATSDYFHMCGYAPAGMPLPPPDGQGAVGFFGGDGDYFEYVGTCLTYPAPANPLLAGTTYTLSLWIATAIVNNVLSQTALEADPSYFSDQFPLALFGYANACVPFPISGVSGCIGDEPGWNELGRVLVQPAWDWTRVSITFTPTQNIHSIMIGGACDVPPGLSGKWITNALGDTYFGSPYYLVDDLMLTIAADQVLQPVATSGGICSETAVAVGIPPAGASSYQWYQDGVALPGQTGLGLDISGLELGAGMYTMASVFEGQCLMGSSYMPPAIAPKPLPLVMPNSGCAPLEVMFADTTGGGTTTLTWNLGDGTTSTDSSLTHTYNSPGSYDVFLQVRNTDGCTGDTLIANAVNVYPAVNGQISATPDPVDAEQPDVQLNGAASGNIISWWWDLGDAIPGTSDQQSVPATFPATPGEYPVMLVIANVEGCMDTVYSMVMVIDPGVIQMPNVFSPNGDGSNDRFIPIDYKGAPGSLEVFNRWGQMIFSTTALAQGWNGSGAPDGTYFYIVTPTDAAGQKLSGYVTLVR